LIFRSIDANFSTGAGGLRVLQRVVPGGAIDLASEPGFHLGELRVDPARLTVTLGGEAVSIEPRVMMVLVVLANPAGRVVSRDELVHRCWNGRIVGDNALQRVVSRIRHLASTLGGFEIQTIPKVGYLVRPNATSLSDAAPMPGEAAVEGPPRAVDALLAVAGEHRQPKVLTRRLLIGGIAATLAAAGGVAVWRSAVSDNANVQAARRLVEKAREADLSAQREGNQQAIAYLKRATELDPDSAEAWGDLALAYQRRMEQSPDQDLPALAEWTRAAANQALAIDPGRTSAKIALATIPSNFRRWAANERALRALRANEPSHPSLEGALGWLLCDVGRWQDAIACFRRALAFEPFHPGNQIILSWALWGGGQLEEVERLLESAMSLWPRNRTVWQSRFDFLVLTGRPEAALALIDDDSALPVVSPDHDPLPRAVLRNFALAMQSGAAADLERAAVQVIGARGSLGSHAVVTYLCALGHLDPAFELLESRFFGSTTVPPPGPLSRRKTSILFSAKGAALRKDPRYPRLTRRIGLDDYWQETGTRPDARLVEARHF
jgi:DNA-binding winged helix-turn-helix (wHTH) protein/tetratricopeptide (TPR) repeat protein